MKKETSTQGESCGIRKVKQSVIVLTRKETSMQGGEIGGTEWEQVAGEEVAGDGQLVDS